MPPMDGFDARYYTLWRRFCAGFIDLIVVVPFFIALYVIETPALSWLAWWITLGTVLVNACYFIFMHARSGQTIGKKAMQVRVVDAITEEHITLQQSVWRELPLIIINALFLVTEAVMIFRGEGHVAGALASFYAVLQMLPNVWVFADALTALFNAKRRSLHDFIGRTVVVRC